MDSKANAKSAWGRIRKNVRVLLGERVLFAGVNFAAATIAARAAGVEAVGALGLLMSFAWIVSIVANSNTWAALIRYGAPLKEAGDGRELGRLWGLTLWVDIALMSVAVAAAAIGARAFGPAMNWTDEMIGLAPWFGLIVISLLPLSPSGLLRLYDRMSLIALKHAMTATVRLAGVSAIWFWGGGVAELALAWVLAALVAELAQWALAAWIGARNGVRPRMAAAVRDGAAGFPRFWRFVGASNLISTLDRLLFHVATLIVGVRLGPYEAGLFFLVRQITETMVRPGDLLGPLFFSEFALLEARGDRRALRRLVKRAMIWTGLILAVAVGALALFGGALLGALFGDEARAAREVLALAGVASAFLVWGFTLDPILLNLGRTGQVLWSSLAAWAAFGLALWPTIDGWGLIGVGLAMIAHRATGFLIRFFAVARLLSRANV